MASSKALGHLQFKPGSSEHTGLASSKIVGMPGGQIIRTSKGSMLPINQLLCQVQVDIEFPKLHILVSSIPKLVDYR